MDETLPEYEQFERRQLAQERDNHRVQTVDIDESRIVQDLRAAGTVVAVPEDQCLVHRPSGESFDSDIALVHFHRGWEAATDE